MAVLLIAFGLLLTGIDIQGISPVVYPEFHVDGLVGDHELSPSIITYTTKNVLGNYVKFDYLPDVLGCLLILAGVCMLVRRNKKYLMSLPFLVLTVSSSVLLRVCGFLEQGPSLVVWVLVLYFLLAGAELFMEYFVLYSTTKVTDALVNRAYNTRMLFGWWISVFCRVFMIFLNFVGHFGVGRVYQVISALATLFFIYHLIRSRKYVM